MVEEFRGRHQVHESRADETALDRRSLTLGAALLTSLATAPIAEADNASTEPADYRRILPRSRSRAAPRSPSSAVGRRRCSASTGLISRTASIPKLSGRSRRPTTTTITTRR